jgi:hypothetical protein
VVAGTGLVRTLPGNLPGCRVVARTSGAGLRALPFHERIFPIRVALGVMMRVEHLFTSPGHNFFGHHGQPAGGHLMIPAAHIECVAGRGIRGDRFFDYPENHKGQITFFAMEVLEALRRELNLPAAPPQATRRNAFVRGADLNALLGRVFEIQGTRFEAVEESKPCYWMNSVLVPGAEAWLKGRAGLRCRILTDGLLRREA